MDIGGFTSPGGFMNNSTFDSSSVSQDKQSMDGGGFTSPGGFMNNSTFDSSSVSQDKQMNVLNLGRRHTGLRESYLWINIKLTLLILEIVITSAFEDTNNSQLVQSSRYPVKSTTVMATPVSLFTYTHIISTLSEVSSIQVTSTYQTTSPSASVSPPVTAASGGSSCAGRIRRLVSAVHGGSLDLESEATLRVGPGCLSKDTEITMIKDEQYFAFKELLDMQLLKVAPLVLEFLPDGLTFAKAAEMEVRLPYDDPDLELFVLHGSYSREKERVIWQVVNDELNVQKDGKVVNMRVKSFCFYSYILAKRGKLARVLSHLNKSFNCYAVGLYRRIPSVPNLLQVAVVLQSEYIERKPKDEDELNRLQAANNQHPYNLAEKGSPKRIDTQRSLEVCLEFPSGTDHKEIVLPVKIDKAQLDTTGMVLDNFPEEIYHEFPAFGKICIYECHRNQRQLIWTIFIAESENPYLETCQETPTSADEPPTVVTREGMPNSVVSRISRKIGLDWDSLAGLLNIPYEERELIKNDNTNYPDVPSKANRIFERFNESGKFCYKLFIKFLHELDRNDLVQEMPMLSEQDENEEDVIDNNNEAEAVVVMRTTPLTSREMSRLSRFCVDWESLAGLMDLAAPMKENIRNNVTMYPDSRSKMEKVLDIFNRSTNFCREKLSNYLKEMRELDLEDKLRQGKLRCLEVNGPTMVDSSHSTTVGGS